ncbi:MAG: PmoA family protein, partial [Phycisphaerae bacterium]|nr:PmoA family protein [Phycisphaerae bacterium]
MIERPGWPGLIASLCLAVVVCLWPGPAAPADTTARAPAFEVRENADRIVLRFGARPVLAYHKSAVPPPKGADPAYRRSGFIHPLHTPSGAVVTGIHPPDHVHHFGLWHAWVKSRHAGRQLDFWNLKKKQATVRFARTVQVVSTLKGAGFTVEQEHVDLTGRSPRVILRDIFQVAVEKRGEAYLVDYVSKQTNVTDAALELPAYRYGGGIAFRGPSTWKHPTGQYLSSAGRTRADGHQTRSRW